MRFGLTSNKKVVKFLEGDLGEAFNMTIRVFSKAGDSYYKVEGDVTADNIKSYVSQYK